jgi:hypothetical protein
LLLSLLPIATGGIFSFLMAFRGRTAFTRDDSNSVLSSAVAGFVLLLNVAIFDMLRAIEFAASEAEATAATEAGEAAGDSTHPFFGRGLFFKSLEHDLGFIFGASIFFVVLTAVLGAVRSGFTGMCGWPSR